LGGHWLRLLLFLRMNAAQQRPQRRVLSCSQPAVLCYRSRLGRNYPRRTVDTTDFFCFTFDVPPNQLPILSPIGKRGKFFGSSKRHLSRLKSHVYLTGGKTKTQPCGVGKPPVESWCQSGCRPGVGALIITLFRMPSPGPVPIDRISFLSVRLIPSLRAAPARQSLRSPEAKIIGSLTMEEGH